MTTDEEKSRIAKLLDGLDVPEVRLTERCHELVKEFQERFAQQVEEEEQQMAEEPRDYRNPYKVDEGLLEENARKMKEIIIESKRKIKEIRQEKSLTDIDPKRPWRTHSNKEKLLRIDQELKRHQEKGSDMITPMSSDEMQELIKQCRLDGDNSPTVTTDMVKDVVESAKKDLPNFQYRTISNTTATAILPSAHVDEDCSNDAPKYVEDEPMHEV